MSSFNNLPPYLSEEILLKSLEKKAGCKLEIVDIKTKVPDLKGAHFASAVNTFTLTTRNPGTGKNEEVHLFVKTGTPDENRKDALDFTKPTYNEVLFFTEILPEFRKICETESDGKVTLTKFPYCYYAEHNAYDPVVIEDLTINGFQTNKPTLDNDIETTKLVLKYLAAFHAVGNHFLRKTENAILDKHPIWKRNAFSPEQEKVFGPVMMYMFEQSVGLLKTPEHMDKYNVFMKLKVDMFKKLDKMCLPEDPLNVLLMGDVWNNNLMFKYGEDGKLIDFRFIDFQMVRHDSMLYDMAYYLLCSTDHTTWKTHMTSYLQTYYQSFADVITSFKDVQNCPFTYKEFEKFFYLRIPLGFPIMCFLMCIRHAPSDHFSDPTDANKGGDLISEFKSAMSKMVENEETRKILFDRVLSAYDVVESGIKAIED